MRPGPLVCLLALTVGCGASDPPTGPQAPPTVTTATTSTTGFRWIVATPESQGMCGSTLQLGCTKTLDDIWASISNPIHNTLRFVVTRNDRLVYNKGASIRYRAYSSNKGLLEPANRRRKRTSRPWHDASVRACRARSEVRPERQ